MSRWLGRDNFHHFKRLHTFLHYTKIPDALIHQITGKLLNLALNLYGTIRAGCPEEAGIDTELGRTIIQNHKNPIIKFSSEKMDVWNV